MACIAMTLRFPYASYIEECSSSITSNGYNLKVRCHIVVVLMFYIFLSFSSCDGNTTYTGRTVNFRYSLNNHVTVCYYETSTDKFDNHVFKSSKKNERVAKETCFKVCAFMTVSN